MRILHVVPTYFPAERYGGPIHSVHGLCKALAAAGHQVHVFTTSVDGPNDSDVPHEKPVALDGVQVTYFRSTAGRRLYYAPTMERAVRRAIEQFDVVHLHSVFLWPTSMTARIAVRARVPYVLSPRGALVRESIARKSTLVKCAWLAVIEAQTLADAAGTHLTSRRELREMSALPLPMPAPFIVPNGVEVPPARFGDRATARIGRLAAQPYVLYLGRLSWVKGLDRMLQAMARSDVRIVLCGNDDEGYRNELTRLVREHGIGDRVIFEAAVSGDDKWALLAHARFLVLPSYTENFGNVVVEAMTVGCPVVVTEEVGASEIVELSGAGLVSAGNVDALSLAMSRVWQDAGLRERQGAAGAAYVRAHLEWPRVAEQMLANYARIEAESRGDV